MADHSWNIANLPKRERPRIIRTFTAPHSSRRALTLTLQQPSTSDRYAATESFLEEVRLWVTGSRRAGRLPRLFPLEDRHVALPEEVVKSACALCQMQPAAADTRLSLHELYQIALTEPDLWAAILAAAAEVGGAQWNALVMSWLYSGEDEWFEEGA